VTPTRRDTVSIVTTLPTVDEGCIVLDEFLDDSDTLAIPAKHLTPEELKLIADAVAQTVEAIAADFERSRCWFRFDQASARVRGMRALLPQIKGAA
jgi:hypothetical protein